MLSAIICRVRDHDRRRPAGGRLRLPRAGLEPAAAAAVPTPRRRREPRRSPPAAIRRLLDDALAATGLTDADRAAADVRPPRLPPDLHHRRHHERDAAAHRATRGRAPRHQHHHGLQGRLPRGGHQRPPGVPRPPPRTTAQPRNTAPPPTQEWEEFLGHFERRKLALGDCGRAYGTTCIHEHSCVRCPLLRVDPAQRHRLNEIRDNLLARIARGPTRRLGRRSRRPARSASPPPRRNSPSSTSSGRRAARRSRHARHLRHRQPQNHPQHTGPVVNGSADLPNALAPTPEACTTAEPPSNS